MATLLLIRHGQASYGQADYDRLSPLGVQQAAAIGRHFATKQLDAVYAGPLVRQQQTAQLAREAAGATWPGAHETLAELAEYPAFDMLRALGPRLVAEDPKFAMLASGPTPKLLDEAFRTILAKWARDEWQADGVERPAAFVARVRTGLERVVRAAASGARVAVVTSAGPIGVAVGLAFGLTDGERMVRTSIVVRNASITELVFKTGDFAWRADQLSLVTFNHTSHLPDELHTER